MALNIPVLAVILLLAPLFYLLLASPAFLLVRLDIPQVAYILRSVFFGYFLILVVVGLVAAALYALEDRAIPALGIGLLTAADAVWARWMMRRMDARLAEIQAGHTGVGRRLRRLHWAGMATNALQTATLLACIPYLAAAA